MYFKFFITKGFVVQSKYFYSLVIEHHLLHSCHAIYRRKIDTETFGKERGVVNDDIEKS